MGLPPSGHLMGQRTGLLLDEINRREDECGRPMLSALVVRAQERWPGAGFFMLARQLGHLPQDATDEQQRAFWEAERDRVYEEWSK